MKRTLRSRRAVRAVGVVVAGAVAGAGLVATTAVAAEDSPWSPRPGFEPKAAAPEVALPGAGSTVTGPWMPSNGKGDPGAAVSISVDGAVVAETEVLSNGSWMTDVLPDSLPHGEPFDATVTQSAADGDVQEVVVEDITLDFLPTLVIEPSGALPVEGGVTFGGQAVHGEGAIVLLLEGTLASGDEVRKAAFSTAAEDDLDAGPWDGEFQVFDHREGGREWIFAPGEALEDGDYMLSTAVIDDAGELSNGHELEFVVGSGGGGDESGGDESGGDESGGDESGGDESGGDESGGDETGTDAGAEDGTDEGAEDGMDEGAEDGMDEGAEDGTDEGAEDGTDEGAEDGMDDGAEDGTDGGAEDELPDTGSSGIVLTLAALMLLAAGGVGVALRGRRATV